MKKEWETGQPPMHEQRYTSDNTAVLQVGIDASILYQSALKKQRNLGTDYQEKKPQRKILTATDAFNYIKFNDSVQRDFDRAMQQEQDPKSLLHQSFNPVHDRSRILRFRETGDVGGEAKYIDEIRRNIDTDLGERLKVAEGGSRYLIKDGEVYSEFFLEEPFEKVLKRGAEYRKKLAEEAKIPEEDRETDREGPKGEMSGWKDLCTWALTAKIGEKRVSLSPRGIKKDTAYAGNFVDIFEKAEEDGQEYLKLFRIAVDFDQKRFIKEAKKHRPDFFDGYDGRPWDAWMKSKTFSGDIPGLKEQGISLIDFSKILDKENKDGAYRKLVEHYIILIRQKHVNWVEIAMTRNTILNWADKEKGKLMQRKDKQEHVVYYGHKNVSVYQLVNELGRQEAKPEQSAGCPSSKGYKIPGIGSFMSSVLGFVMEGSVGKFAAEGKWFSCSECHYQATGPIGNGPCPGCGFTKEKYKEKYGVECA